MEQFAVFLSACLFIGMVIWLLLRMPRDGG